MSDDPTDHTPPTSPMWVPPAPAQVPALHARVRAWVLDPHAVMNTGLSHAHDRGTLIPHRDNPVESAAIVHTEESHRLATAHLYSVDAETTAEAVTAGAALPDCSLDPQNLPAPTGFMVFDTPIGHSSGGVAIVACSWGPTPSCAPPGGAVWLTFWSAPDPDAGHALLALSLGPVLGPAFTDYASAVISAPLMWDNEALICWNRGGPHHLDPQAALVVEELTGVLATEHTLPWVKTVIAAWRLLAQPEIVTVEQRQAPRPDRRRAERAGRTLAPVRVVGMHRRDHGPRNPDTPGHTWGVRVQVSAHWRNQAVGPGRSSRDLRWIRAYWAGPQDAPVSTRPKVTRMTPPPDIS